MKLLYRPILLSWILSSGVVVVADDDECNLFLADSSLPNAGFGIFTGRSLELGEPIPASGSLGIPLLDATLDYELLQDYLWNPAHIGGWNEANESVGMLLPGLASMANRYFAANVMEGGLTFDEEPIDADPAFRSHRTPYHSMSFLATHNLKAGSELFLPSDEAWLNWAEQPTPAHAQRAGDIVLSLKGYHEQHPDVTPAQWVDILHRIKEELMGEVDLRVKELLPRTLDELLKADPSDMQQRTLSRSLSWLKKHGLCLDNMKEGPSTIPGAGRGAFANRRLSQGSMVHPVPLVHVTNTSLVNDGQLLQNYCLGHLQSEVLLCPMTHLVLVNHDSAKANVKLRWGKTSSNRKDDELEYWTRGLEDLAVPNPRNHVSDRSTRLLLEVIALRDIEEDEELFLDYGSEWEDAFTKHQEAYGTSKERPKGRRRDEPIKPSDLVEYDCFLFPFATESESEGDDHDYPSFQNTNGNNWNQLLTIMNKTNDFLSWYPCRVDEKQSSDTFRVAVYSKLTPVNERILLHTFVNVPESAIRRATVLPYESYDPGAFRSFVGLGDDIFPLRWRQDYKPASPLGTVHEGLQDVRVNRELQDQLEEKLRSIPCGFYFAPSSIPNAGFGVYTAVDLPGKFTTLGSSFPVVSFARYSRHGFDLDDYVWSARVWRSEYDADKEWDVVTLSVNEGALANYHPGLVNAYPQYATFRPRVDRCDGNPGAGAYSEYVEAGMVSDYDIKAGEEIFVSYGETWFSDRAAFADVPLSNSYLEANKVVSSITSLQTLTEAQMVGLLDVAKESFVSDHRTRIALSSFSSKAALDRVLARNGVAEATVTPRSTKWLAENGMCIDNLYVKESTVEQAGHGAFARRRIPKGDIIVSNPLIIAWGRGTFDNNSTKEDVQKTMLLLNYQLSHPDSSLYLTPTSLALSINHDRSQPNAKVQWSKTNKKSAYYLQKPLEDLKKEHYSALVIDFVAIMDIEVDDEIFIDYGEAWQAAWDEHASNFDGECQPNDTRSSKQIFSLNKGRKATYEWGPHHFTVCQARQENDEDIFLLDDEGVSHYGVGWDHEGFELATIGSDRRPCLLLSNSSENTFTSVHFLPRTRDDMRRRLHLVVDAPLEDMSVIPKPFKTDTYWKGSFRHEIHIPDDVFPSHWRDLAEEAYTTAGRPH